MKSFFVLLFFVLVLCFALSTLIGCVMALIEIIRNPSRYDIHSSVDDVPEDYFEKDKVKPDETSVNSDPDKVIIS